MSIISFLCETDSVPFLMSMKIHFHHSSKIPLDLKLKHMT